MPDTFTHIALPSLFSRFIKSPLLLPVFLIGTVLPDYLREFLQLVLPVDYYSASFPFHTLVGVFFSSLLLTAFFVKEIRRSVFHSLLLGQVVHLLFDALQMHLCGGRLLLFFPLWKSIELPLFSESHWMYLFAFSLVSFILYWVWNRKHPLKNRKTGQSATHKL